MELASDRDAWIGKGLFVVCVCMGFVVDYMSRSVAIQPYKIAETALTTSRDIEAGT
jgi:hypothetical protein